MDEVEKLCEGAMMLGEIGLDEKYAENKACIPHQRPLFEVFLEVAERENMLMNFYSIGLPCLLMERMKNERRDLFIEKVRNVPDDLLVLEIDELPNEYFKMPFEVNSTVFFKIIKAIAEIRNSTPEEIKSLCHKNVLKLIGSDSRLKDIRKVLIR
jgi:Tat protein secretion system quality control protein TatD with DNase activity